MNIFLRIITFPLSVLKWIVCFYLAIGWKICKLFSQLAPRRHPDRFDVVGVLAQVLLLMIAVFFQIGLIVATIRGVLHPEIIPECERCHSHHIFPFCFGALALSIMLSGFIIMHGCNDEYRALVCRGE